MILSTGMNDIVSIRESVKIIQFIVVHWSLCIAQVCVNPHAPK